MIRTLLVWLIVRLAFFSVLCAAVIHDWVTCLAFVGAFTLVHAETLLQARAEDRARWGRWRN